MRESRSKMMSKLPYPTRFGVVPAIDWVAWVSPLRPSQVPAGVLPQSPARRRPASAALADADDDALADIAALMAVAEGQSGGRLFQCEENANNPEGWGRGGKGGITDAGHGVAHAVAVAVAAAAAVGRWLSVHARPCCHAARLNCDCFPWPTHLVVAATSACLARTFSTTAGAFSFCAEILVSAASTPASASLVSRDCSVPSVCVWCSSSPPNLRAERHGRGGREETASVSEREAPGGQWAWLDAVYASWTCLH